MGWHLWAGLGGRGSESQSESEPKSEFKSKSDSAQKQLSEGNCSIRKSKSKAQLNHTRSGKTEATKRQHI